MQNSYLLYKYLIINSSKDFNFLPKNHINKFKKDYKLTVGTNIHKVIYQIEKWEVIINFWEISLSDRFKFFRTTLYNGAKGVVILSSISNRSDYKKINSLIQEIDDCLKSPILLFDTGKDQTLFDKLTLNGAKLSKFRIEKDSQELVEDQIKNSLGELLLHDGFFIEGNQDIVQKELVIEPEEQILDGLEQYPKIFISHAEENDAFNHWLNKLATDLYQNKFFVRIDIWDLKIGDNIKDFMRKGINDSDWIVVVFTKEYLRKSNLIQTGVYYENNIFSSELFSENNNDFKMIPLLKEGDPSKSIPKEFRNLYFIDFRIDSKYEENIKKLVNTIKGIPKFKRPELQP